MKNFFIFLLILILGAGGYWFYSQRAIMITAKQAQEDADIHEMTAQGKIQSLGSVSVSGTGTHLLIQDDKTTILLTALGVNLQPYEGKNVEVEGRATKTASGKELIQVLRIRELTVADISAVDATSHDWTPYENFTLGVKFLQRKNWSLKDSPMILTFTIPADPTYCEPAPNAPPPAPIPSATPVTPPEVTCLPPKDDTISVEMLDNSKMAPLISFTGNDKFSVKNIVGPDKLMGYKYYESTTGKIIFVVSRDKSVFRFTYTPGAFKTVDPSANDFHALQSSFQFVPVK